MIIMMIFGGFELGFIRFFWCFWGKREFFESSYINNKNENNEKCFFILRL